MLCPVAVVDIPVNDQDTLGAKAAPGDCRGDGYIVVCNRMDRFYAYTSVHSTKKYGENDFFSVTSIYTSTSGTYRGKSPSRRWALRDDLVGVQSRCHVQRGRP